jgi:hypothetical protein
MARFNTGEMVSKAAVFGLVGWALENALCGERYSQAFAGHKVPWLPVYAANGIALTGASSYLSSWPMFGRGLAYAAIGTAVEWAGCQIDRKLLSQRAGVPGGGFAGSADALFEFSGGCVNFTRSVLWGGLGLVAEKFK